MDTGESAGHRRRVGSLTSWLARELGIGLRRSMRLAAAAELHDLGNLAVPSAALEKEGPLSMAEWQAVRRHPSAGALLLGCGASPMLRCAATIALCHHERWDGSGYPNRLAGKEIPLAARLVHLADQYDVLRTRRGLSHVSTVKVLIEGDGRTSPRHFDPAILAAFARKHKRVAAAYRVGRNLDRA